MSNELEGRPAPHRRTRGPEPLRRKRVQPVAASDFPSRRKLLNILLAFAAGVLLIDALVGEKGLLEGLRAREAYRQAETSLDALKRQNATLMEEVRRLNESQAAIEGLAREELGLIKPGETMFIIRDAPSAPR